MENEIRVSFKDQQIIELLMQGYEIKDIAKSLGMARRTVKGHLNRMYLRFGITGGIKRVKLAVMMYRRLKCQSDTKAQKELARGVLPTGKRKSSVASPRGLPTRKSLERWEQQNTSLRTILESYMTN